MKWLPWRRSPNVEDYRDQNKSVDNRQEPSLSINDMMELANSKLAHDAGTDGIGKLKLVSNWRQAPKFWSIQLALVSAVFGGLWVALPAFQDMLPPIAFALLCVGVSLIACILRLIKQSNVDGE